MNTPDDATIDLVPRPRQGTVYVRLNGKAPTGAGWTAPHYQGVGRDANGGQVGIRTDALAVVDADLDGFADQWAAIPGTETPYQQQSGGAEYKRHFFYRAPVGIRSQNLAMLDAEGHPIIGDDGLPVVAGQLLTGPGHQVVAAGAIHPDTGRPYRSVGEMAELDVEALPPLPLHLLAPYLTSPFDRHADDGANYDGPPAPEWGEGALRGILDDLAAAGSHARNNTLNALAFRAAKVANGGHVDWDDARERLVQVAETLDTDPYDPFELPEIERTIDSAHRAAEGQATGPQADSDADLIAQALFALEAQRVDDDTAEPGEPEHDARYLPDEFWNARPHLKYIYKVSTQRLASADAVLRSVLARVAAARTPKYVLPGIIGTPASLNYFTAIVGFPGAGKSIVEGIADELLPTSDLAQHRSLGSGQGVTAGYFGKEKRPGDTTPQTYRLFNNVLVHVDEGGILEALGQGDSILYPALNAAWAGKNPGTSGATQETTRYLAPLSYSLGLSINLQPGVAGALLRQSGIGTPQRFTWSSARPPVDPPLDGADDADIEPLAWAGKVNALHALLTVWGPTDRHEPIGVPINIRDEVRAAHQQLNRMPDEERAALPMGYEHEMLMRLKEAALLAELDGRHDINDEDWRLAKLMADSSRATQQWVVAQVAEADARTEDETNDRFVRRALAVDSGKKQHSLRVKARQEKLAQAVDAAGCLQLKGRDGYRRHQNGRYRQADEEAFALLAADDDYKYDHASETLCKDNGSSEARNRSN